MTLIEAKILLERNRIPYHTAQYENEGEYWHHCMPFSRGEGAKSRPVVALVIPSVNGVKDIELQFIRRRGEYEFHDLWFGSYDFEMFGYREDCLEADILETIGQIVDGKLAVIECCDLKKKRRRGDACFDLTDDDNVFGSSGFREAVEKIERPKTFWQKLTGQKRQYEIYDWRTYRQIVK